MLESATESPSWTLVWLAFGSGMVSLAMLWRLIPWARRRNALDTAGHAGHVKVLRDVPNIGGLAFAPMPLVALGLLALAPELVLRSLPSGLLEHQDRILEGRAAAGAISLGGFLLLALGILDDRRALPASIKLVVQFLAAALAVFWGGASVLEFAGPSVSVVVSLLWIVAVTNAINFIDNMDGLAGGLGFVAAMAFGCAAVLNSQWLVATLAAILGGGLLGFLRWNVAPAKVFMGDGGSLPTGFLLAVVAARTTWWDPAGVAGPAAGLVGLLVPLGALAIPLYDLVAVTCIRMREGRSPFAGDQRHLSHRLVQRGISGPRAVFALWLLATVFAGLAIAVPRAAAEDALWVASGMGLLVLGLLVVDVWGASK